MILQKSLSKNQTPQKAIIVHDAILKRVIRKLSGKSAQATPSATVLEVCSKIDLCDLCIWNNKSFYVSFLFCFLGGGFSSTTRVKEKIANLQDSHEQNLN